MLSYLKEELLGKVISISYEWFRDTEPLFEMKDRLNLEEGASDEDEDTTFMNYCVPIKSPAEANYLQIKFTIMGNLLYAVAVILVIAWAIGFIGFGTGGIIHILLVIALIAVIFRVIDGRRIL